MNPEEIILFFKRMKTMDILWLLIKAKIDKVAEWVQEKSFALHRWGANARKAGK